MVKPSPQDTLRRLEHIRVSNCGNALPPSLPDTKKDKTKKIKKAKNPHPTPNVDRASEPLSGSLSSQSLEKRDVEEKNVEIPHPSFTTEVDDILLVPSLLQPGLKCPYPQCEAVYDPQCQASHFAIYHVPGRSLPVDDPAFWDMQPSQVERVSYYDILTCKRHAILSTINNRQRLLPSLNGSNDMIKAFAALTENVPHERIISCHHPQCGFSFMALHRDFHMTSFHQGNDKYRCKVVQCFQNVNPKSAARHRRRFHPEYKPVATDPQDYCPLCIRSFGQGERSRHITAHHDEMDRKTVESILDFWKNSFISPSTRRARPIGLLVDLMNDMVIQYNRLCDLQQYTDSLITKTKLDESQKKKRDSLIAHHGSLENTLKRIETTKKQTIMQLYSYETEKLRLPNWHKYLRCPLSNPIFKDDQYMKYKEEEMVEQEKEDVNLYLPDTGAFNRHDTLMNPILIQKWVENSVNSEHLQSTILPSEYLEELLIPKELNGWGHLLDRYPEFKQKALPIINSKIGHCKRYIITPTWGHAFTLQQQRKIESYIKGDDSLPSFITFTPKKRQTLVDVVKQQIADILNGEPISESAASKESLEIYLESFWREDTISYYHPQLKRLTNRNPNLVEDIEILEKNRLIPGFEAMKMNDKQE